MYFKNMIYINIKENKYCLKLGEKKKRNVGVVVKNLPANARDTGFTLGPGRFHLQGQLSTCTTMTEPHATPTEALESVFHNKRSCPPQLESSPVSHEDPAQPTISHNNNQKVNIKILEKKNVYL